MRRFFGIIALLCPDVSRADYAAGKAAWEAGRHGEAVKQWQAAARAQDGRAMLALGRAFAKGLGVPQDFVEAHKWLNLAAGRGIAEAVTERNAMAREMTKEERAEARKLARAWRTQAGQAGPHRTGNPPGMLAPARRRNGPCRKPSVCWRRWGTNLGLRTACGGRHWRAPTGPFLRDAGLSPADTLTPDGLNALRRTAQGRGATGKADKAARPPARAPGPDALHRAVLKGDIDGLKAALKAGANVNARDSRGWTALMHAANKGYKLLVPSLLAARADPDIQAADGATALFMAAVHGHAEIVALLMKAGADISVKGPKGKTAVDVARLRYGTATAARKKGAGLALLALLNGKTLAQATEVEKAAAQETTLRLTPGDRRAIQAALAALGFKPGPVDGVFGERTRKAIEEWQRKTGLAATGRLTAASASTLKATAKKMAAMTAVKVKAKRERPGRVFPGLCGLSGDGGRAAGLVHHGIACR